MLNVDTRNGGLLLSTEEAPILTVGPLRAGPDVSWISRCKVGDNQGREGACAIFALANWAEVMHGKTISDNQCLELYAATLRKLNRTTSGLTFSDAFAAVRDAGWLPGSKALVRAGSLAALTTQPLIAGYEITGAWDGVSPQGCLDHQVQTPSRGYHAVLIVGHGTLPNVQGGPWVYIENSWGLKWGWNGLGIMSEALHRSMCREMWGIM